jgi:hypothetical protein
MHSLKCSKRIGTLIHFIDSNTVAGRINGGICSSSAISHLGWSPIGWALVALGLLNHLLSLNVLVTVDLNCELVFSKVINKELRHAIDVVKLWVIELGRWVLALAHWGGVLGVIHVELVLAINIVAEVSRQVRNMSNLYLKVNLLVHKIHWVIWQYFLIKLLISIFVARNNINMNLTINFMISGHNWNNSWIIHHVSKTLKHVKGLSQKNWLLFFKEWI